MAFDRTPLLHQVNLEVKYAKGMLYLDKCGTTLMGLTSALDQPFRNNGIPRDFAEAISDSEFLSARFGPESFLVAQRWVETIARFQIVAPVGWGVVSKSLGVSSQVTRCGARYYFIWPVSTKDEGSARLKEFGLFEPSETWSHLLQLPPPTYLSPVAFIPWESSKIRIALDTVRSEPQGYVPREFAKFVPTNGIQLDLDFVLHDGEARTLNESSLREFCVNSSAHAKKLAGQFGEVLETCL